MPEDERLREALLELQVLRKREAAAFGETKSLLACVQAYSSQPSPTQALPALLGACAARIGAGDIWMLECLDAQSGQIVATASGTQIDDPVQAPIALFNRSRLLNALRATGAWQGPLDPGDVASALLCPIPDIGALLALSPRAGAFAKSDLALLEQVAGLAGQGYRNTQIAEEKDLLSAAIAGSSSGIAIADARSEDKPLIYVNSAFESLSGYSAEEVIGQNCRLLTAEAEHSPERVRIRETVKARGSGLFLLRNKRKSGDLFWNELALFPVRDASGEVRHLVATQTDVTARIDAADTVKQVHKRLEDALSATDDAFLVLNDDGSVAHANTAVGLLFPAPALDWAKGSLFSDNWAEYLKAVAEFPVRTTALLTRADLQALATLPNGRELDLPDGRSVLVRAAGLADGGLVVSATNITAMKAAQDLLSQRLAAIEAAPDGIAVCNDDGRLIYANSAAAQLMGYLRPTAAVGRVWWHQYRSNVALSTLNPFEPTLAELDDAEGHTHEITASPLETGGFVLVVRDVTEKLAVERREEDLTRDLMRLQRQEAAAQVAAGMAHDFNNALAAINGSATLIDMEPEVPEPVRAHARRIFAAGAQAAKMVNQLLDMGSGAGSHSQFDLGTVLSDVTQMARPVLPSQVDLSMDSAQTSLVLQGDPTACTQVLLNLVMNAGEAIGAQDGQVVLTAEPAAQSVAAELKVGQLNPAVSYARLRVSDTGHGMRPQTLEQIFQPYFTTKGAQGTGLGMAMVAAQVKSMGGAIAVHSELGRGTQIDVFWPLSRLDALSPSPDAGSDLRLTGLAMVVVDDDPNVGDVIARYLEAQGAEVTHCIDALDALEVIEEAPEALSALITDYDMPGMSGGELAQSVRQAAPDLPIFVVTALARRLNDPRLTEAKVEAILPKPVDLDALSAAVWRSVRKGAQPEDKGESHADLDGG